MKNLDKKVIEDFGDEWKEYNQSSLNEEELENLFNNYFNIFPFHLIDKNSEGFDMGSGSGRWAKLFAPKVKILNCIEPSKKAIEEAKKNLRSLKSCNFSNSNVFDNDLEANSQDFGYCLGVLHHIENTESGLVHCVKKLKKNAPFLLYLYYKFDNKPLLFVIIWKISNFLRNMISKLPFKFKIYITKIIAFLVYFPLARLSLFLEIIGININNIPLSYYRRSSLYTMKTDSLDRFGTRLEQRFTKNEIYKMMKVSGLINIKFSEKSPYWVAVGIKK